MKIDFMYSSVIKVSTFIIALFSKEIFLLVLNFKNAFDLLKFMFREGMHLSNVTLK